MVTQPPRLAAILVAVVFVIASIALSLFVWRSLGGGLPMSPKGYRFHATFENASQLQGNADVRIAGIDVGKVVEVRQAGRRTDATIEMDAQFAPVPADTRAILRQKTLLGETFVALTPGSRQAPGLPEGGRLAVANVAPTQPLDRVLGTLDAPTRGALRALLSRGAAALDGRGAELNAAFGELGPLSDELDVLLAVLDGDRRSLRGLVRDTGDVLRTLGDHRAALADIVASGADVLAVTARRDRAVTETVRALGPLLDALRETSGAVGATARAAGPTLRELRPVTPLVAPALRALRDVAPDVDAVLADLDATLPAARRALPAAAELLGALGSFVDALAPATHQITPVIDYVSRYRRELVGTLANVGAALQATSPGLDGRPVHYLRALVPTTEESFVGYAQRLPSNRHNAYFAPGTLDRLGDGLPASSCANLDNPQTVPVIGTGAPPCRLQAPWTLDGRTAYFHRVGG